MADAYTTVVDRTEIMKQIGINLGKLKTAMNWTQAKMADLTGVAEPTMANYLKGERLPGIDFFVNLCAMPSVRKKGIFLRIDDFLSNTFDPERAQKAKTTVNEELPDEIDHNDFVGVYICYFYDQSKAVHDRHSKADRELRLGLLTVYNDYNCVTGEKKMKVFASFYKEKELQKATELKKSLVAVFKNNATVADRNEALFAFYASLGEGVYEGEVLFSNQHAFVHLNSGLYKDNALIILYLPQKRSDCDYLGGLGSIASISRGSMHMPSAQKIIVSRYELGCSFEEISDHLSMTSAPVSQTQEAMDLAEICKKLYDKEAPMAGLLDESDKTAIIETRLNQLVRNYIEKNVCCVGSVSEEEDKTVYSLIKRYVD